jgi:exopolysaccharide production protein ExoQ
MEDLHTVQGSRETRLWFFWLALVFIFIVFFLADGHDPFWSVRDWGDTTEPALQVEEGSVPRRISFIFLGAFGILGLLRRDRRPLQWGGLLGGLMLGFLAWAFLSLVWTDDILLTSRRLVVLAMLCLGALAVVTNFSVRSIILMVFLVTGGYLALGLIAEVASGAFHVLEPEYRFAGTLHPNHQGINCFLLLLTALLLVQGAGHKGKILLLGIAVAALVFLVLTKSRTAFIAGLLALFVYWSFAVPKQRKAVLVLIAGIMSVLLVLFFGDAIFHGLGEAILLGRTDDPDSVSLLTGRVPLWKDCIEYIARRPFQGYGYGAFWTPRHIYEVSASQEWGVAEAHSAYLELTLSLGLIGAVAYVLIMFIGIRRAFASGQDSGHQFLGVLLVFGALGGFLESAMVAPCLLFFLSIVALCHLGFTSVSQTTG